MSILEGYLIIKAYAEISGLDIETAIKEIEKSLKEEEVRKYVDEIKAQIIKTIDKKIIFGEQE